MKAKWTASFATHTAEWIAAIVAIATLVLAVTLRSATNKSVEITLDDALISAIAGGLALLFSGKIAKLIIGADGVTIETTKEAILDSTNTEIRKQVLPVEPVSRASKGGPEDLPNILSSNVQALDFTLGQNYDPNNIKNYLEALTRFDFFHYLILNESDGTLFGMIDARRLKAKLSNSDSLQKFSNQLNGATDSKEIEQLPGFVPASDAVTEDIDKREVLRRMEKTGRDWLPVIDERSQFKGVVDQSRLTASIILDVTDQLQTASNH